MNTLKKSTAICALISMFYFHATSAMEKDTATPEKKAAFAEEQRAAQFYCEFPGGPLTSYFENNNNIALARVCENCLVKQRYDISSVQK